MEKIIFIGPKALIQSLQIIGLEALFAESESQAEKALDQAVQTKEPCLIFINERLAVTLTQKIDEYNQKPHINIVAIPDNQPGIGSEAKRINRLLKSSIGAEMVFRR